MWKKIVRLERELRRQMIDIATVRAVLMKLATCKATEGSTEDPDTREQTCARLESIYGKAISGVWARSV